MNLFFLLVTLFTTDVVPAQKADIHREYYENGKIKSVTRQGIFKGCGVPVGTDSLFSEKGMLSKTILYTHIKDAKEEGCHAIQTYEKQVQMSADGKIASVKYYTYGYESTPVVISAGRYNVAVNLRNKSN